jgi:hypothetical protein
MTLSNLNPDYWPKEKNKREKERKKQKTYGEKQCQKTEPGSIKWSKSISICNEIHIKTHHSARFL